jgi:hypothetical protein
VKSLRACSGKGKEVEKTKAIFAVKATADERFDFALCL